MLPCGRAIARRDTGGIVGRGVPNGGANPVPRFLHKSIDIFDAGEVVLNAGGVKMRAKEFPLQALDEIGQGIVERKKSVGGCVSIGVR